MFYDRDFFTQNACTVARNLLGAILVRELDGIRLSGRIVETEAYTGFDDPASHAHPGKTRRNMPMWGTPGLSYVYLNYGMYWLLNVACEPAENPAAVLIRALEPLDGQEWMALHRHPQPLLQWTSGPGRLTRALKIDGTFNLVDLTTPQKNGLWLEQGTAIPESDVQTGARIGLGKRIPSEWRDAPLRWWVRHHPHVSV